VDYVRAIQEWGNGGVGWFTAGAGSWSNVFATYPLTDNMTIQNTPKILALDDVRTSSRSPINHGILAPGDGDARLFALRDPATYLNSPTTAQMLLGQSFDYLIRTTGPRTVQFQLTGAATESNSNVSVGLNGFTLGSITLPITGSLTTYVRSTDSVTLNLPAGYNTIRLTSNRSQGFVLKTLHFTSGPSCNAIDFNHDDVFPDLQDIIDFFSVYGNGPCL
jgi:hypothetical protein